MKNSILLCLTVILYIFGARAEPANFIGQSVDGVLLKISPDGKWLLVSTRTEDGFGSRKSARLLILNLQTSKFLWRQVSLDEVDYYGWTADNRLYYYHPQILQAKRDGKSALAICEIEKPDGTGYVACQVSPEFAKQEWINDFAFSTTGDRFFIITGAKYQIYDTFSGNLIFDRTWNLVSNKISSRHFDARWSFLSPEGDRILADEQILTEQGSHATGIRKVLDARTGRTLSRITYDAAPRSFIKTGDFLDSNTIANYWGWVDIAQYGYRASDGQLLWTRWLPRSFYGLQTKDELILTDPKTGKDVKYMPPRGAWRDIAISPDRKTLYTIDVDGKIFHFPAL